MENSILWMILSPFVGSLVLGLLALKKEKHLNHYAGWMATGFMAVSFVLALLCRRAFAELGADQGALQLHVGTWMSSKDFYIPFSFKIDAISSVLALVVTGIGSLVHLYSVGYMHEDKSQGRFFCYLNLFCGFMLILITATSLPLLFIGWEGVGLCSYLLIGFWYEDLSNSFAGRKAFVVNRIGDAGMLIAMFMLFAKFGTLNISELAQADLSQLVGSSYVEWIVIFLFIGCVGKSAQLPLYIWLPDAMAGPTPVSALIHAATMVTAGVYVLARFAFLLDIAPFASQVVAITGAVTAFFAATIALFQSDIKKVMAFSTVSQLGFMILAMGVGAYSAGLFHLVTHAYFKALLFLGAGSVIHAMHHEQDMFKMGGLRTFIAITVGTMIAGWMAIIGFPFTSGFFSKDEIIYETLASGHPILFTLALLTALLTSVYMTRMMVLVFSGKCRSEPKAVSHIHESPWVMTLPLVILAMFALFGGLPFMSAGKIFTAVFPVAEESNHHVAISHQAMGAIVSILSLIVAFLTYRWVKSDIHAQEAKTGIKAWMKNEYNFNTGSVNIFTNISRITSELVRLFDVFVIDGIVNGIWRVSSMAGSAMTRIHSGSIRFYALGLVFFSFIVVWMIVGGKF